MIDKITSFLNGLKINTPDYDFTIEQDREKACLEYSECMMDHLNSSSKERMYELDVLADKAGYKFIMINYARWALPESGVRPKYLLVDK